MYSIASCTKMMRLFPRYWLLSIIYFLFFVQLFPSTTALCRSWVKIKSTNQSIQLLDFFAFEKRGGVDLWVYDITFTSSSNSEPIVSPNLHDLSQIGFYLSPRGTKGAELLKEYNKDKSICYLHSDIGGSKKIIYTFDKLDGTNQFNTSEEFKIKPGYYSLLFENCVPNVEVSMVYRSGMYNQDGTRSHYFNWWTNIGTCIVYPIFLFLYVVVWNHFRRDSRHILEESCNFRGCFILKLLLIPCRFTFNLGIDQVGFPFVLAFHWCFFTTAFSLILMRIMLYLQSGYAVRTPLKLRVHEKEWGYVACIAIIISFLWETYYSLEPCDAYRMGCFLGLNAIRCIRTFAVILMLYRVWKDGTDDESVKLTKSLVVPRSNLFFFTLLSHFGVLHLVFLLTMFPSTSAVAIALEESAYLALFSAIYHLYSPPPSAHVADDNLETTLINSQ